jgi:hypothetical protein
MKSGKKDKKNSRADNDKLMNQIENFRESLY